VILLAATVIIFMPGLVAPWSRLNNEEEELDLLSGRARFTRHFLWCQVRQDIRETLLSKAVAASRGPQKGEQWVKVNIFQPNMRHSPHFAYHGAFGKAIELAMQWASHNLDAAARAKSARQLLRAMREGGSDDAGSDYLRLLQEALGPEPAKGQTTSADKIPDDLVERALARQPQQVRQQ